MLKGADMSLFEAVKGAGLISVLQEHKKNEVPSVPRELNEMYRIQIGRLLRGEPALAGSEGTVNLLEAGHVSPGGTAIEDGDEDEDEDEEDYEEEYGWTFGKLSGKRYEAYLDEAEEMREATGRGEEALDQRAREFIEAYRDEHGPDEIVWVRRKKGPEQVDAAWVAYGNQATMAVSYSSVSLVVKIPSWWERG